MNKALKDKLAKIASSMALLLLFILIVRYEMKKNLPEFGVEISAPDNKYRITPIFDKIKILGLALSIEPRFSLAELIYPIKGPVYLDEKTEIREYVRKNNNGYISPQKLDGKPKNVKKDVLKELEEWGLKIK